MILIPEIETVLLLVPRCASTSLSKAVLERYPKAMMLYRHMEADGVPAGYDRWDKVGVVREPMARLWSLYKYLRNFNGTYEQAYIYAQRASVQMDFSDWILNNQTVFTNPYDSSGKGRFWPKYNVLHSLPETRKSQFMYLRPDLGTQIYTYDDLHHLEKRLDVSLEHHNVSEKHDYPIMYRESMAHVDKWFSWDINAMSRYRI